VGHAESKPACRCTGLCYCRQAVRWKMHCRLGLHTVFDFAQTDPTLEEFKMLKYFFTYIVECSDKSYYTGITNDIDRRLAEHNEGENKNAYTFKRRPVTLVYAEQFLQPEPAIEFEKQIKGWSRQKKEALINDNWDKIQELAKCKNETSHLNFEKIKKGSG